MLSWCPVLPLPPSEGSGPEEAPGVGREKAPAVESQRLQSIPPLAVTIKASHALTVVSM